MKSLRRCARLVSSLALAFTLTALVTSLVSACAPTRRSGAEEERWVEGRLLAPCCWTQTLDVHESPLAGELRAEIHRRLAAGEQPAAIEDDLASRYGEPIRALPRGRDPRHALTLFAAAIVVLGTWAFAGVVRQWKESASRPEPPDAAGRDPLDERLDDELRDVEG
jgi:cytochrome c-type biogenesis protein CcmH